MTTRTMRHYEQLAALFDYPRRDYPARAREARAAVRDVCPSAASYLDRFVDALPSSGDTLMPDALDEMQEVFTRSFDVQSITTLSVGYVTFGDDYKRGELLVNLNRELRDVGIDCGSELSDHLPNILRLTARWQDREILVELVEEILRPALGQMIAEFGQDRIVARDALYKKHFKTLISTNAKRSTVYSLPLQALAAVLDEDFALHDRVRSAPPKNDFLTSVRQELEIEADQEAPDAELVQLRSAP